MRIIDLQKSAFSLDVEADGPVPHLYSMVSFGFVNVYNPDISFYAEIKPISDKYIEDALKVSGFNREQTLQFELPEIVMNRFENWVKYTKEILEVNRLTVFADNPGFDWGYLNYYMHRFTGQNILGHSCRRINDYYAGATKDPFNTNKWKSLKVTKHSHNALDDARGNAEALKVILEKFSYNHKNNNSVKIGK
jgi:DNA polymerase III epsilon subunit-like protein